VQSAGAVSAAASVRSSISGAPAGCKQQQQIDTACSHRSSFEEQHTPRIFRSSRGSSNGGACCTSSSSSSWLQQQLGLLAGRQAAEQQLQQLQARRAEVVTQHEQLVAAKAQLDIKQLRR
jgi:hypothetical protein